MDEVPPSIPKGVWIGLAVVALLIGLPASCVLSVTIPRSLADSDIEPKCKAECGVRVFEEVVLKPTQSRVIGKPTWVSGSMEYQVGGDFVLKQSHVFSQPHGVSVYKYTTWLERLSDGKRLSEMTWYLRQGDEVFHGKHFPQPPPTQEQLVEQTLVSATPNPSISPDAAQ